GPRYRSPLAAVVDGLAQPVAPARLHAQRLLDAVVEILKPRIVCFHANCIDGSIGSAATRQLFKRLIELHFFVVEDFRTVVLARELQALGKPIDPDHTLGPEQVGTLDGKLANRTASPHRYGIAGLDIAV